jgi:tetratricopeptide (TPR) repeat protein
VIFGWRKGESGSGGSAAFQPQPDKAAKFFDHARTVGGTGNHEYALKLFADGLKFDPANLAAHQAMYETAIQFFQGDGKPASGKDLRAIEGSGPVHAMVVAEYAWMRDLNNVSAALRLLEAAGRAEQPGFGQWLAPKMLNMLRKAMEKKPQKKVWVAAIEHFSAVEAWNEAFACGEEAQRLDPSDSTLEQRLRQLTAARAIQQGGYQQNFGQSGSFRTQVRDTERQKELEAANTLSGSGGSEEIALEKAKRDFEENPMSPEATNRLGNLLRKRGQPEDEAKAIEVFMLGYQRLSEYRFKMNADDVRIMQLRRAERDARAALEQAPENPSLQQAHETARMRMLEVEGEVYRERAQKYPTNRDIKADLGRVEYDLGRYEEAMAAFQAAKDDPKLRVLAAWMLGRCFAKENWHSEAAEEFREAIGALDATQAERELEIKYDLMNSLIALATAERNAALAKEAADICSFIVRKNISFRDVRQKRKDLDELIRSIG